MSDLIHNPEYYTWRGGMECIDIAKELCQGSEGVRAYLIGCAVKYIYRYPKKNGLQDVLKATQCLVMLLAEAYGQHWRLVQVDENETVA